MTYLHYLNKDQIKAVTHESGPALVLAGAGSGKTTVLTHHAAWLIQEKGVSNNSILLVTFTNKSAQEMMNRIETNTGSPIQYSGTFHSLCAKILRKHATSVRLTHNFVIYDADDQLSLLKHIQKQQGVARDLRPALLRSLISVAKNEMKTPDELAQAALSDQDEQVARLYRLYEKELQKADATDFDDLLLKTVDLFENNPHVAKLYQEKFQHILVDEYQDTNKAQYALTQFWAAPQNNLFVVGDFCQSIYSWRGADFRNMLQFKEDYPHHTEYRLEQNYRSNQSILDAASSIIGRNQSHPTLNLWTDQKEDRPIRLLEHDTGDDEARAIVKELQQISTDLSEVAVLYRTNAQSRPFEEQCIRLGVPYKLIGGVRFYERKEIKDILCYTRLFVNPTDTVGLQRAQKLGKRRLSTFLNWRESQLHLEDTSASTLLRKIVEVTHYLDTLDEKLPDDQERIDNILELYTLAEQEPTLSSLLQRIALIQDTDVLSRTGNSAGVSLMSLHSAKGLEFEKVYLVGMEEGLLPHSRSLYDSFQLEEERRLCYVGITRAKQHLCLSYARTRFTYGRGASTIPSRFLSEIPQEIIHIAGENTLHSPIALPFERTLISDDDLDAVLKGEISISTFINS